MQDVALHLIGHIKEVHHWPEVDCIVLGGGALHLLEFLKQEIRILDRQKALLMLQGKDLPSCDSKQSAFILCKL